MSSKSKRVYKNIVFLYIRMMVLMFVTLYTSRVILEALGVVDLGISNVVGAVIVMLSFINNSMALAVNRFLAFELGKENWHKLRKVFCISVNIHILMALIVVVLGETIGLWFINTQLVIPPERMVAANWVYQFSIITFVFAILKVPYNAAIIAHEEIRFYAYMGVLEGILRLMIAISLLYFKVDKLILYGGLLAFTTSVMTGIFYLKCKRSYQECNYKYFWEKKLFKEMFAYAGISTMGNLSTVAVNQGQNILLNIFFGPVVNAARAISYQINGALSQFVTNIYTASTPQITKSYATNDRGYLVKIVNQTSLLALICLLVFLIPLLLELPSVLKLWLGDNAPPNTALFCHFILIDLLLIYVCRPLLIAIQSSGKILKVHLYTGCLELINIPIAYVFLKYFSVDAYFVFMIKLFIDIFFVAIILYLSKIQLQWNIGYFIKYVILRSALVGLITFVVVRYVQSFADEGFFRLILVSFSSLITVGLLTYYYILNARSREQLKDKLIIVLRKRTHK